MKADTLKWPLADRGHRPRLQRCIKQTMRILFDWWGGSSGEPIFMARLGDASLPGAPGPATPAPTIVGHWCRTAFLSDRRLHRPPAICFLNDSPLRHLSVFHG